MVRPYAMTLEFAGEVWFWKGPAPWYFVTVPEPESRSLREVMTLVTYGWGMIPVNATVGGTTFYTALWEKDGRYIVPLKAAVRKSERISEGDTVRVKLDVIQSQ